MRRGISRLLCRAGLVVVGLGGAALLLPATAGAVLPNPPCDTTLYHSIKLHSNQSCFDSPGYIVGRSGITVNLNGFTLSNGDDNYSGIDNTSGFNHVTVENGSVTGFSVGVYFEGAKNANVNNVDAQDNGAYGIDVDDSTNGAVTNSTADDNAYGVVLYYNHMVTVSNTNASDNSIDGFYDELSLDTLTGDTASSNGEYGVYVEEPLTTSSSSGQLYWTIDHSAASDNSDTGVYIDDNSPTTLYQAKVFDNTATFNGTSGSGFGFWAYQKVKGYGNGVRGNASGNCHNVPCHSIP